MAGALSGHFSVLAAHDLDEALRLIDRHGPCQLAYCEVGGDIPAALDKTRSLTRAGVAVIALVRPPCPDIVREAAASGRIQGVCQLPLSPEALRARTREALGLPPAASRGNGRALGGLLTREEVDFLLGRTLLRTASACPSDS